MQNKISVNTNLGMLRDRSISKTDNQFAFENHNIRITARDKDTLLSVTNERGNVPIVFSSSAQAQSSGYAGIFKTTIEGQYLLGYSVLNDYLVLFTTSDSGTDYIYRIQYLTNTDEWYLRLLYQGSLGFSATHPIETISLFETQDVQKVYWVDGINQPRVINIMKNYFTTSPSLTFAKNTIFNFVTDYNHSGNSEISVSVEKQQLGMGSFPAGTIQYLCTYYNKYGQETNPVYISPVYYISPEDRGGDAETTYTCSFKISLSNADSEFEYVKVYAVLKTSESGNPIAYIVGTINIKTEVLTIVDTGQGDNVVIDPTILLYIGGREITAGTFSHKDNTLFLGDINFKSSENDKKIEDAILDSSNPVYNNNPGNAVTYYQSNIVTFGLSGSASIPASYNIPYYENSGLYPYESQLNYPSSAITSFKGGEKYRFALQFITATGQRSRAFFIGDATNNLYPEIDTATNTIRRPLPVVIVPQRVISAAHDAGYKQVELLMAEANDGDRAIVAQGIVSPTVFNLGQRCANAPYALSSWFMRPRNCQINSRHFQSVNNVSTIERDAEDENKIVSANVTFSEIQNIEPEITPYYNEESFKESLVEVVYVTAVTTSRSGPGVVLVDINLYSMFLFETSQGNYVWKEKNDMDSETITTTFPTSGTPSQSDYDDLLSQSPKFSIRTGQNLEDSKYNQYKEAFLTNVVKDSVLVPTKTQLWNLVDLSATVSNPVTNTLNGTAVQDVQGGGNQTRYATRNSEQFFIDENIVSFNAPDIEKIQSSDVSGLKFRIIGVTEITSNISDYTIQTTTGRSNSTCVYRLSLNHTDSQFIEGLGTYPLLYDIAPIDSNGDLIIDNNTNEENEDEGGIPYYFDIYPFHKEGSVIYNETLKTEYSKIEKKTFANLRYCYNTKFLWTGNSAWRPIDTDAVKPSIAVTSGSQSAQYKQIITEEGPFMYQGTYDFLSSTGSKEYSIFGMQNTADLSESSIRSSKDISVVTTTEPVRVQFQSLSHAVIKFGKVSGVNEILPSLQDEGAYDGLPTGYYLPWDDAYGVYQQELLQYSTSLPYYFIGELYKDIPLDNDDRYGGKTQSALENNKFITISERYNLGNNSVSLLGIQGDTYFQRWDCLKTEPYSSESKNGIVDITSFMVETHTNIDGRYDARRGLLKNVTTTRENSNKINRVYSNNNDFFASSVLNDKYYLSEFHNQITWTKTKTLAEDVDSWTNLTVANTLDLDGDKGPVRAIRRFNNTLIAFQDKGIAEILFNSRTQIATTSGVPIEIANSGKVDGKRYISEKSGCTNKWSIVEAKTGIYFIDNINKNISVIGQGLQDISTTKGFNAWIKFYNTLDIWNPKDRNNFVAFYDGIHNDVYFVTKHEDVHNDDSCLVYNETLGQFTSFFDYEDLPMMVNLKDRFLSFKNNTVWKQNEGEYNKLFNTTYPYWIQYRICPDPYGDKTFNNIEYRADITIPNDDSDVVEQVDFLTDKTFDTLKIWNEYQNGTLDLVYQNVKVSDLKKKFRIWRANIPRDDKDPRKLNRIRNPWVYMQLSKTKELDNERMEFHDLLVKYYE